MQSISISARALKAGHLAVIACGWLALAGPAHAGQYQLLAGQPNSVVVAARVQNAEQVCNLEITVQGQAVIEREVQAPFFEARIDITPQDVESVAVTWRGKFKRVNDVAVNACPTQGRTQFVVVDDNSALRSAWRNTFLAMEPAKAECVRTALQLDRVRYEWFDMAAKEVSAEDRKIQRAMSRCDDFLAQKKAWGEQNPKGFACTLSGGLKTRCEGFFTATDKGKAVPITAEAAIRRQLDQQPWGTGVRETSGAKAARQKQEQAARPNCWPKRRPRSKPKKRPACAKSKWPKRPWSLRPVSARKRPRPTAPDACRKLSAKKKSDWKSAAGCSSNWKSSRAIPKPTPSQRASQRAKSEAKPDAKPEAKPEAKTEEPKPQ
jgi:hypothetical protein